MNYEGPKAMFSKCVYPMRGTELCNANMTESFEESKLLNKKLTGHGLLPSHAELNKLTKFYY